MACPASVLQVGIVVWYPERGSLYLTPSGNPGARVRGLQSLGDGVCRWLWSLPV